MADGRRYRIQTACALMADKFISIEAAQAWANEQLEPGTLYATEECSIVRRFQAFRPHGPVTLGVSCKCCCGKCGAP